jgi:UDP-N-acetylmuramoyl-L-alanyl-D-glutamate--2,6-diaminopimelate ligase
VSAEVSTRLAAARARLRTVGVTGTNGKTTTTSMVAAIVAAAGEPSARVTTVGAWVDDESITGANLAHEFLVTVERAAVRGVRTIAVEMTSKALAAGLARTWPPDVGVFTNLTRDHLDIHGSPEAYLAAKAQLVIALAPGGAAVLNGDDPAATLLAELVPPEVSLLRFSQRDPSCALAAERVEVSSTGTRISLARGELADRLGGTIALRVVGGVHAQNALAAALAAHALGYPADAIGRGLATFAGVPGRFEVVATEPLVIVDYAHTPDGLAGTLATARALCPNGHVVCVFGCGGNRDRGKRPEMGAIADACADVVVLTTDNPRHEDPRAIAAQIMAGVATTRARWIGELDRARAIERAIALARPIDVVVIAGKGHEQVQEIGGAMTPFSDVHVAREAYHRATRIRRAPACRLHRRPL